MVVGEAPLPIDVFRQTSDRARRLADTFRAAVANTVYYRQMMFSEDDLPARVVDEYAEVACLCRLAEHAEERDAVHEAMFGIDPSDAADAVPQPGAHSDSAGDREARDAAAISVARRRRAVAHYLTVLDDRPFAVGKESEFREGLWAPRPPLGREHAFVAGQWSALIAKDVWQDALCSVWSQFCRDGLQRFRQLGRGLTWEETRQIVLGMHSADAPTADTPASATVAALKAGKLRLTAADGTEEAVSDATLPSGRRLCRLACR